MSTHRHLAKQTGIIGLFTAISRVLGFVRDLIIATAFGTGIGAEAFVVSFKIPNLLRDLVGEGAASSSIVPVLTEYKEKKPNEFWPLVSSLFTVMAAGLAVVSALGVLLAPVIVTLIAPGFVNASDPDKFPLTVQLTRVIFPYILLIGLSALCMGVLNSLKEFASSALGPILLNISLIMSGFFFEKYWGPMALVIGVLVGGVLQLACQIRPLLKRGFRFYSSNWKHAGLAKIFKLMVPRALGSALYQINVFVDSILASFEGIIGVGGQSALYYANRLFQLPLAIFGVALAQALLPTFSGQLIQEDKAAFRRTFSVSVRTLAAVIIPASVGLILLSEPIIRIIFEHGRFDAYSTQITSQALFFYAFGLLSCSLIKIYANAFYAMQDTRTPVRTMLVAVGLNVVLSALLMFPLKIGGLTLASSISATVNLALLHRALRQRMGSLDEAKLRRAFLKIIFCSAVMGAFVFFFNRQILDAAYEAPRAKQAVLLASGILGSIIIYAASAFVFKMEELAKVFKR